MSSINAQSSNFLADHRVSLLQEWGRLLALEEAGDPTLVQHEMKAVLEGLIHYLQVAGAHGPQAGQEQLNQALAQASQDRALRGQSPASSVRFIQTLKSAAQTLLAVPQPQDATQVHAMSEHLGGVLDHCVTLLVSHFVSAREAVIHSQAQSLLELSTPVILLWDSILLLPLVGVIDSVRAVQIAERLLENIGRTEAAVTLIDVTGVPVMDTSVARHLLRTVSAAELLGTKVILTGISPSTAQTMVKLGINLSVVPTKGSLKAGLSLALDLTGRQIMVRRGFE